MLGLSRKQHIMYIRRGQAQAKLVSHQNFNLPSLYPTYLVIKTLHSTKLFAINQV